jgi:3-hydroxyisobutyrate dehydrogenase-like beta-hydroxyacid dehydrogenase
MSSPPHASPVGIIGLGLVGMALAERLMAAGHIVVGFDVDARKIEPFSSAGGRAAASILDVGRACDIVVIAVYDTPQVIEVVEGAGGLVQATGERRINAICVSTCEPEAVATLARRAAGAAIDFIECPLSGNSAQVRAGEATGLVAGNDDAIARSSAILDVLCPRRFAIGQPGDAARAKLAINLVLQLNRAALAEGIVFAVQLGLDAGAFLEVLAASPAHSDVMEAKAEKMLQRDYAPQSRIAQTLRDAELILAEARRHGQRLPLMEVNAAILAASIDLGGPDRDSSAVIEAIRDSRSQERVPGEIRHPTSH